MRWLLRAALSVLLMSALCAGAQSYPNKPIRLVVPYPPGALTDLLGRAIGDPIGCLALVDALPDGVRDKVRSRNAQRIFEL